MSDLLRLVDILAWPIVVLVGILVLRPHLSSVLSGAKIKLNVAGQSIETTLPELKVVFEEQAGDALSPHHIAYLNSLLRDGARQYAGGIEKSEERKFLRPLRNAGLVLTVPRNEFLSEAKAIEVSSLGRLYLRAHSTSPNK